MLTLLVPCVGEYQGKLEGLISRLTQAGEMAQGLEEKHTLADEQHQSEMDSMNRQLTGLREDVTQSQSVIAELKVKAADGRLRCHSTSSCVYYL